MTTTREAKLQIDVTGDAAKKLAELSQGVKSVKGSAQETQGGLTKMEEAANKTTPRVKALGDQVKKTADETERAKQKTNAVSQSFSNLVGSVNRATSSMVRAATAARNVATETSRNTREHTAYARSADAAARSAKAYAEQVKKLGADAARARGSLSQLFRDNAPGANPLAPRGGLLGLLARSNDRMGARNAGLSSVMGNLPFLNRFTNVTSMIEGGVGLAVSGVTMAVGAAAAGIGAMAAGTAMAVREASQLETGMSRVRAATAGTRDEMARLTQQASVLGAQTVFNAAEVAAVQENFAKAGFSVSQITEAVPAALSFASASGTDTNFASSLIAQTVRAMGFEAGQSGAVADALVVGAQASNVDVGDLGETLKYAAPIFASMGRGQQMQATQDLVALSGILGDQGIRGSQAGTSLRTAFTRLAGGGRGSGGVGAELRRLGVTTTDDSGNMRRLPDILASLRDSLDGKTTQQRTQSLSRIFGAEAAGAMGAILNADPARFAELVVQLDASGGAAERTARIMQDNLGGDLERLGGAFSGLGTTIGTALLPETRAAALDFADLVDALNTSIANADGGATALDGMSNAIDRVTDTITLGIEAMVPRLAGFAELVGILDEGEGAAFAERFAGDIATSRISRASAEANRARDQVENESQRRRTALNTIQDQIRAAQGDTGSTVAEDVRSRFRDRGLEDIMNRPEIAAAINQLESQGPMNREQRRAALAALATTMAPALEEGRGANAASRVSQLGQIGAAELQTQASILSTIPTAVREARGREEQGASVGERAMVAILGPQIAHSIQSMRTGSLDEGNAMLQRVYADPTPDVQKTRGTGIQTNADASREQLRALDRQTALLERIARSSETQSTNTGRTDGGE
jgi:TP901 family phage tail tape measure protein